MAGRKLLINNTNNQLKVTLFIRLGDNPANSAGTQDINLSPHQQSWVDYGNSSNIYLNGLSVLSIFNGQITAEQEFVIQRGQILDNQLNMNNVVQFSLNGGGFQVATWNG